MPLLENEIVPGAVAYLSLESLRTSNQLEQPALQPQVRTGPFVCIEVEGSRCSWLEITGAYRAERLLLDPTWKLDGSDVWRNNNQYINDARVPFIGPKAIFVTAGADETAFAPHARPHVSNTGVTALLGRVDQSHGTRL